MHVISVVTYRKSNLISHLQTHHRESEDEPQNHQQKTEGGLQYEDNEEDINDLKLERLSKKAISQNTDSSIHNILKVQNDESTKSEKIEKTEKKI